MIRRPLTGEQRRGLAEQVNGGHRGSILLEPEGCPVELEAHPGRGSTGGVRVGSASKDPLSPDETRRLAMGLLQLADHAEFGPGEWRGQEWRSTL